MTVLRHAPMPLNYYVWEQLASCLVSSKAIFSFSFILKPFQITVPAWKLLVSKAVLYLRTSSYKEMRDAYLLRISYSYTNPSEQATSYRVNAARIP